jgi:hypothetical protein
MKTVVEIVICEPVGGDLPRDGSSGYGVRVVGDETVLYANFHSQVGPHLIRNYRIFIPLRGKN